MSLLTLERAVGAGTPVAPSWGWKYWGVEAKLGGHKESREGRDAEGPEYLARLGGLKACRKEGKVCPGWTAVPTGCLGARLRVRSPDLDLGHGHTHGFRRG